MKATLIASLRLPEAVAAGLPDPSLARELNRDAFPDYPDWPRLVQSIARTIGIMLTLMAIGMCTIARRRAGMMHITRGLVGLSLFVASILVLGQALRHIDWHIIAAYVQANRPTAAVAQAMEWATGGLLILAAMIFVAAPIFLVWPARDPRERLFESKGGAV